MLFSNDYAYTLDGLIAGQILRLARRLWSAITEKQPESQVQGDVEFAIRKLTKHSVEINEILALIVQCLQMLLPANANSSHPAPATEHQPSSNHATRPPSGLEVIPSGPGYQTALEQEGCYSDESEADLSNMTDRELMLLLIREVRQLRKEVVKGALLSHH